MKRCDGLRAVRSSRPILDHPSGVALSDLRVVLDLGKRIVEGMEELPPAFVGWRLRAPCLLGATARAPPSARPLPRTSIRCTRFDGRQTVVDSLEQVRLLRAGGHGQADEVLGQANVREDATRVVVEVQEGARLQLEDPRAPLAKHGASTKLREKRRDAGESAWTSVLHTPGRYHAGSRRPWGRGRPQAPSQLENHVDVVGLERKQRLVRLVGRLEPVPPVELDGGTAGSRGDVESPGAVRARQSSDLFRE